MVTTSEVLDGQMSERKEKPMNENTARLLDNLATKLGTTSEYLWSVLLKQAPISGWIAVVEIVIFVVGIVAIAIIFNIHTAIIAFANPEYWALKEVLSSIKGK